MVFGGPERTTEVPGHLGSGLLMVYVSGPSSDYAMSRAALPATVAATA